MPEFQFQEMFPLDHHDIPWRRLSSDGISVGSYKGSSILEIEPGVLTRLTAAAIRDVSHLFRPGHLAQLARILDDPEASSNDRFVARQLLLNANVSAGMVLPSCQDTGTAIVIGKKGQRVWTNGADEEAIAAGVYRTYTETSLRYSQLAPLSMFEEVNTGTNLPAQIDLYATGGDAYDFLFITKGGGSANKTFLYQETKALLNPKSILAFLEEKLRSLGTAACPPYHLAIVIGGTSAEMTLKTVKLASTRYLDHLPTVGNRLGHAIRDTELEQQILQIAQNTGIGAQFGGKYFCHDVRVIRLPRHGASVPIGILEQLETNPAQYLPDVPEDALHEEVVKIDLNRPMSEIRATLSRYPIKTRLSLSGTLIVARDIAHAKLKERLEAGLGLPDYIKDHPVYYAGPAKTPTGYASGSFGPTTAGRMDAYVDMLQQAGGSHVMLAKGNRSKAVTEACQKNGGFYLGSIGGPAAILARDNIKSVKTIDYPELGMEAVWRIEVEDFPAFIVVDDKGNDFFALTGKARETGSGK